MSVSPKPAAARLTRHDWIEAGQALLREHGFAGVKLRPLLDRLDVTTGSFYHHFKDFAEFLDALADDYGLTNVGDVRAIAAERQGADRLAALWQVAAERDIPTLDRAMRIWATTNPRAATAVRKLDAELLAIVCDTFIELGFPPDEARARTLLVVSAGVGNPLVFSPWPDDPADAALTLRIVMTPLG